MNSAHWLEISDVLGSAIAAARQTLPGRERRP